MKTIALRPYAAGDRAYVCSTWVSSLRSDRWHDGDDAPAARRGGERGTYWGELVDKLLDLADLDIVVACDAANPTRIEGWCAVSRIRGGRSSSVLHFVYMRKEERGAGIAGRMLERAGVRRGEPLVHTFTTKMLDDIDEGDYPTKVLIEPEEFIKP